MSRHGTKKHCSACNSTEHDKRRCPELGRGGDQPAPEAASPAAAAVSQDAGPDAPPASQDAAPSAAHGKSLGPAATKKRPTKKKKPNTKVYFSPFNIFLKYTGATTYDFSQVFDQNRSVIEILMAANVATQHSQAPGPLPQNEFIANQRDSFLEPRATTATHALTGKKKGKKGKQ
ncbi:hypothetical protein BRADI_3g09704v3 [Brachypodium distachyon]|uniref:Uncharacterized protein n=1 Tax=Brachypodium distachyon TaxID=15368 RepID=A0A2K2CW80_BRADI|nr:hypothetical protein BRADI_3g09704v3 [Brachypodium distachyon]